MGCLPCYRHKQMALGSRSKLSTLVGTIQGNSRHSRDIKSQMGARATGWTPLKLLVPTPALIL